MVFPPVVAIGKEYVVEDHRAQAQHYNFSNVADVQRCIKPIRLKRLPTQTILIAESDDLFSQNVAQKTELETFMKSVCSNQQRIIVLKKENLASPGIGVELKQRNNDGSDCHCRERNKKQAPGIRRS